MIKRTFNVLLSTLIVFVIVFVMNVDTFAVNNFDDVPPDHWSYQHIMKLRELEITGGIGDNKFGFGQSITRAEFVTFLTKLLKWDLVQNKVSNFTDVDNGSWYFSYVETAFRAGITEKNVTNFRPDDKITREEIAVMLVKSLGYEELSTQLSYLPTPFSDVENNKEFITMAKDFGLISGIGNNLFAPNQTATREQAATMMIRMYDIINKKVEQTNAFYAISSASQADLINNFDSIAFGWSRLEIDMSGNVMLNTSPENNNEYKIPNGFESPLDLANGKLKMLMISVKDTDSVNIMNNSQFIMKSVETIANSINNGVVSDGKDIIFDGVVLDFEALKGETAKNNYNEFLKELKKNLIPSKKIFVAVHPQRANGHEYYDGYDYKIIGQIADKVILMAHDYNAKKLTQTEMDNGIVMTPLAPISEVYYALKMITDAQTGAPDTSKIMLQVSFDTAQWKIKDGKVINETPYNPDYTTLANRIKQGVEMKYSEKDESPYIKFQNNEDGTSNIVWYENERSVSAKIKLAKMFGVNGISIWRLGNVPNFNDDIGLNVVKIIND